MKASIESTARVVDVLDVKGRKAAARVWKGVTEAGIEFTAYIVSCQVRAGAHREAEFERELVRSGAPDAETLKAVDMRFVI